MTDINLVQVEANNEDKLQDQVSKILIEEETLSPTESIESVENDESNPALETAETVIETAINETIEKCEEKSKNMVECEESKEESTFLTEVGDGKSREENQPQDRVEMANEAANGTLENSKEKSNTMEFEKNEEGATFLTDITVSGVNETIKDPDITDKGTIKICQEESMIISESEVGQDESTFMTEVADREGKDENDPDCLEQLKMSIENSEIEFPLENQDKSLFLKKEENEAELLDSKLEDGILDRNNDVNQETSDISVSALKVEEIDVLEDKNKEVQPPLKDIDIVKMEQIVVDEAKIESEKVPVFTLFMIAYVIFMSLILFCH